MEMCYDGALVMPSSYAVMDEEEMTYVEGGKTYTAHFGSIGAARKYYRNVGGRLQIFGMATGFTSTVLSGMLGVVGGWAGGIIGAIAGSVGNVSGSIIYGWGSKYIDCANSLSKYKASKRCSVKWKNSRINLSYSISVK